MAEVVMCKRKRQLPIGAVHTMRKYWVPAELTDPFYRQCVWAHYGTLLLFHLLPVLNSKQPATIIYLVHVRHHSPGVAQLVLVVQVVVEEFVVPRVVLR